MPNPQSVLRASSRIVASLIVALGLVASVASAVETIRVPQVGPEDRRKDAGFFQNDRICVWVFSYKGLSGADKAALYVNADAAPTGRQRILDGADYHINLLGDQPRMVAYGDTPASTKRPEVKATVDLSPASAVVVRKGDTLFAVFRKDVFNDPPVADSHGFRFLTKVNGKTQAGSYDSPSVGGFLAEPLVFGGFAEGPAPTAQAAETEEAPEAETAATEGARGGDRMAPIRSVQMKKCRRTNGKDIEAGYRETDDAYIWSVLLPTPQEELDMGASFNLYINADMKPTGRAVVGGADYQMGVNPAKASLGVSLPWDLAPGDRNLADALPLRPIDFYIVTDGPLTHVVVKKRIMPVPVKPVHDFRILHVRQMAGKQHVAVFSSEPTGEDLGKPFRFGGFCPQPKVWRLPEADGFALYQMLPQRIPYAFDFGMVEDRRERPTVGLARNETEPLEFVLIADGPLSEVSARLDFGSAPDALKNSTKVHRIGEMTLEGVEAWYDDVLYPFDEPVALKQGDKLQVWINFHAPLDTKPGRYPLEVVLDVDGKETRVPVDVTVWNFTLPDRPSLPTSMGILFDSDNCTNGKPWEMIRQFYQVLKEHRLGTRRLIAPEGRANFQISRDGDRVKIDTSAVDKSMEIYAEVMGGGCNEIQIFPSQGYHFPDLLGAPYGTPENDRLLKDYVRGLSRHLEQKGWLEYFFYSIWDEPRGDEIARAARTAPLVREVLHPGIPLRVAIHPKTLTPGLFGVIDYNVNRPEPSLLTFLKSKGRDVWTYNHNGRYGRVSNYPDENIRTRSLFWYIWRNRLDGFMQYTINRGWRTSRHDHSVWIFPVKNGPPLPGIQLELMREGLEDYEYLKMLEETVDGLKELDEARLRGLGLMAEALNLCGETVEHFDPDYEDTVVVRHGIGEFLSSRH